MHRIVGVGIVANMGAGNAPRHIEVASVEFVHGSAITGLPGLQ